MKKQLVNTKIRKKVHRLGKQVFDAGFDLDKFLSEITESDELTSNIEMSRYIDVDTYHRIEENHPFYVEMRAEIIEQINIYITQFKNRNRIEIHEFGAGTGLLTNEIIKLIQKAGISLDNLYINDVDITCVNYLNKLTQQGVNVFPGSIQEYLRIKNRNPDDTVVNISVSSFAHDHFADYENQKHLLEQIKRFIKPKGIYILGGEFIQPFNSEIEREESLFEYHNYIIQTALSRKTIVDSELAKLEFNALVSGLYLIGDFKTSIQRIEADAQSVGFKTDIVKIGPKENIIGSAGIYVISFTANG